jgi:hypothetical protein
MATNWLNRWRGGAAAVLVGVFLVTLLMLGSPLPARDDAPRDALPADLAKLPSDGMFLLSVRVADLWGGALAKPIQQKLGKEFEEGLREFESHFGLSLDQVERVTMLALEIGGPADPLWFVRATAAYDKDKVLGGKSAEKQTYKGAALYSKDKNWGVYPLDDRSLVYGKPDSLRGLIDHPRPKVPGDLAAAARMAAGKHTMTLGLNVKAFNDTVGGMLPGQVEPFRPLLEARTGTIAVDLAADSRAELTLTFASEPEAAAGVKPLKTGLELAVAGLDQGITQLGGEKDMEKIIQLMKQAQSALKQAKVEQDGKRLQASASVKLDVPNSAVMVLEAIQKVRSAAGRQQSANNLKQIALAMHNYHDTMASLPPQATYDKNGKPLLSWRVLILPYIEQQELYKQFHLDEPWDSEHNKKLLTRMPKVYASPQDENTSKDHTTRYQGFVGKGAFFEGKKGLRFADFTDGTSNTLMIVEASKAVPWSKPEDIAYDPAKPLPKLGLPGSKGFQASLCDGSVRTISHTIKPMTLRNLITRNDGNVIDFNDF